jgi:glycosyltransferase involved in cell wall biosynthesis
MKILQLCYKMPYPMHDGGEYSLYHSALSLLTQEGIELKCLAINTPKFMVNPSDLPLEFREATNFECITVDTRVKPFHALINLFSHKSYFVTRFYSSKLRDKLISVLKNESYDLILLEHLYLCIYLPCIREHSSARVVLRAQNVEHSLWKRYLVAHTQWFTHWYLAIATRRLETFETEMCGKVDGIITLTDQDQKELKILQTKTPFKTIPLGFDFKRLATYDFESQFRHKPVVYHLGSMDWLPNVQGIQWFIKEVFPILVTKRPEIEIHLAGKKMPQWIYKFQSSNLVIDGEVPDSLQYQSDKPILIVPLLSGSGIRVKIIEGLALGKTIVSTTLGATGIDLGNENPILLADDADSFAEKIIQCIDSVEFCRHSSETARRMARWHYNLETVGKTKIDFFRELLS